MYVHPWACLYTLCSHERIDSKMRWETSGLEEGMNVTARVTNHPGSSRIWDEFSGHEYLSAETQKVLSKQEQVGQSKLRRYKIHPWPSWDYKICQHSWGGEETQGDAGPWSASQETWSNWSLNPLLLPVKFLVCVRDRREVLGVMEML